MSFTKQQCKNSALDISIVIDEKGSNNVPTKLWHCKTFLDSLHSSTDVDPKILKPLHESVKRRRQINAKSTLTPGNTLESRSPVFHTFGQLLLSTWHLLHYVDPFLLQPVAPNLFLMLPSFNNYRDLYFGFWILWFFFLVQHGYIMDVRD